MDLLQLLNDPLFRVLFYGVIIPVLVFIGYTVYALCSSKHKFSWQWALGLPALICIVFSTMNQMSGF